uniref:Uncharacterized protein n=1 Tax=Siphoviridae sp. ctC6Q17 TaxID=2827271 RepID=A0A8S5R453_9CAUD|nr:MAG TPA: hypothetical protein [Siphoviridae sp. ctC6Q17]
MRSWLSLAMRAQKKSCLRKTSSILNSYLYYNISKEKRREQD